MRSTMLSRPRAPAPGRGVRLWGGCLLVWLSACDGQTTPTELTPLPRAPDATTSQATMVSGAATATLNGVVHPRGNWTETWFEWGPSTASLAHQSAIETVTDTAPRLTRASIGPLEPATSYYYRLVARNEAGTAQGKTLSFVTPASPPPSAAHGSLAFVRNGAIYIYDPGNESLLVQLTGPGGFDDPAWSPDGSRLAVVQKNRIYLINADGSGLRMLGEGRSPAWSPDGRRLAYSGSTPDGQGAIFVTAPEDPGQPALRIGFEMGSHDSPAWSPDGERIAFVSDWAAFDFAFEVFIANADGSGEIEQVTNGFFGSRARWPAFTIYAQPSWSPDGRSLAVVECGEWQFQSCTSSRVSILGLDGSGVRLLSNTAGYARPGWVRDGSAIVFTDGSGIFEVTLAGARKLLLENAQSGVLRP